MKHRAITVLAVATTALACARPPDPASTTCVHVLMRRLPDAEVVAVEAGTEAQARVRFARGDAREPGQLLCEVEPSGSEGGWRVRAATLDGVELTDAELAVVNADLFLHALARAGAQ